MPLFSSARERRLWGWTLLVVLAIFATLPLARQLSTLFRGTGMGETLFVLGCLLVLTTVVTQGLKVLPSGKEIFVALGVATCYLLVFVRMAIPTERSHLIEYGVLAIFVLEALHERFGSGRHVTVSALLAVVVTTLVGALDETIQAFVPGRVFDPTDMLFNFLASIMAVGASLALRWVRQKEMPPR